MTNGLLDIIPKDDGNYYFSNFGESLIYALIGFVVVFIGIVIIIFIIKFIGFLLQKTNNFAFLSNLKRKKKQEILPSAAKEEPMDGEIPDEIKAAIIAAITVYYDGEKSVCDFKVKRIKKL